MRKEEGREGEGDKTKKKQKQQENECPGKEAYSTAERLRA